MGSEMCIRDRYYTVDEHSRVPEMQICSAYTWQKLSPEDREIILECARESALYEREVWTQREEQSRSIAMENGTKVVELSAEEKNAISHRGKALRQMKKMLEEQE